MTRDYKEKRATRKKQLKENGVKMSELQEACAIFMDIVLTTESERERDNLLNELFLLDEFARKGNYNPYALKRNLAYFELHGNDKKVLRNTAKKIRNYFVRALKADLTKNPVILTPKEAYMEFYLLTWLTDEENAYNLQGETPQKQFVLEFTKSKFRSLDRSLPEIDYSYVA